jgi:hypothetical protein
MKFVALLLPLAACAADLPSLDDVADALQGGQCNVWMCGTNSPVMDGLDFHELNINGLVNDHGFSLQPMPIGQSIYKLTVQDGQFVARRTSQSNTDPATYRNEDLIDRSIPIGFKGTTQALRIRAVQENTEYWAHALGVPYQPNFYSYVIEWNPTFPGKDPDWGPLCATPSPDEDLKMDQYHALVFEGERIRSDTKEIEPQLDTNWFNIGCAGSTLAKLQLTGHTQVAQAHGFSNTIAQRQTMVKMLSADYCGKGVPFTVAGQPLQWMDYDGETMKVTSAGEVEAKWTPKGAVCLNTPRVVANPTKASEQTFGTTTDELLDQIGDVCDVPPRCEGSPPEYLTSWNPK